MFSRNFKRFNFSHFPSAGLSSSLLQPKPLHQSKRRNSFVQTPSRFAEIEDEEPIANTNTVVDDALISTWKKSSSSASVPTTSSSSAVSSSSPSIFASSKSHQQQLRADLAKIQRNAHKLSQLQHEQDPDGYYSIQHPNGKTENLMTTEAVSKLTKDMSGNINHVPRDCVTFVADEFKRLRDLEAIRRKKILAELASPDPFDYSYGGKLVPVPPLNFGKLAPQSHEIAQKMLVAPTFRKVRESPASDYFFELNELYCEISFIGRANAGKSSLINAILGQPDLARTSSVPHSTRNITFYQSVSEADLLRFKQTTNPNKLVKLPGRGLQYTLVDVPGFGLDGMSDKWKDNAIQLTDSYFGQRRSVNTVFMCIDVQAGVTPTDETYFEWMTNVHGVFWIVLTKCDLVPHSRLCSVMSHLYTLITNFQKEDRYRKIYPFVLPVSAHTGENIDFLRSLIVETSGVLPADTLRKLLQQQKGDKWHDAVREEEQRLLDDDDKRRSGLSAVQKQLAEKRGVLLLPTTNGDNSINSANQTGTLLNSNNNELDDDDFAVFDTEFNPFAPTNNNKHNNINNSNEENTTSDEENSKDVLTFEVPDVAKVSFSSGKGEEGKNKAKTIGQFKISSRMTGIRPEIGVEKNKSATKLTENEKVTSSSAFARELAEKLMTQSCNKPQSENEAGIHHNLNRYQQRHQRNNNKQHHHSALLVEQPDGSLISGDQHRSQQKTQAQEKYERKQQRRIENLQQDEIWSKYQNQIDKGDAIATAAALRELKELKSNNIYTSNNSNSPNNKNNKTMSTKDLAAYKKYCGGTTVSGDGFVEHTRRQMALGEQRKVKSMRKSKELEFNHSGRIALKAQPGGLWNQYGSANDGKVNSNNVDLNSNDILKRERRVLGW